MDTMRHIAGMEPDDPAQPFWLKISRVRVRLIIALVPRHRSFDERDLTGDELAATRRKPGDAGVIQRRSAEPRFGDVAQIERVDLAHVEVAWILPASLLSAMRSPTEMSSTESSSTCSTMGIVQGTPLGSRLAQDAVERLLVHEPAQRGIGAVGDLGAVHQVGVLHNEPLEAQQFVAVGREASRFTRQPPWGSTSSEIGAGE